jgi:hypothetical protein
MHLDSLFNGVIITWNGALNAEYYRKHKDSYVTKLRDLNIVHNPLMKMYLTMSELCHPVPRVPYVTNDCVQDILMSHQFYSPVYQNTAPTLLPTFYSTTIDTVSLVTEVSPTFDMGLLYHRVQTSTPTSTVTAPSSMAIPTIPSPFPSGKLVTVEYAVFPFLFPNGVGYFIPGVQKKSLTFNDYL